jgi:hypothetical protein
MADPKTFELDELVTRPGTYFNPQTDVLIVVDDSTDVDTEIFNMEAIEGADWVLIADDAPVDESRRDHLIERFQVTQQPAAELHDDDVEDEVEELEPRRARIAARCRPPARGGRRPPRRSSPPRKATRTIARLATGPTFTHSSISSFTPTSASTTAIVSSR